MNYVERWGVIYILNLLQVFWLCILNIINSWINDCFNIYVTVYAFEDTKEVWLIIMYAPIEYVKIKSDFSVFNLLFLLTTAGQRKQTIWSLANSECISKYFYLFIIIIIIIIIEIG